MLYQEVDSVRERIRRLMALASILNDHAGTLENLRHIPTCIARILHLRRVHLALLRWRAPQDHECLAAASSDPAFACAVIVQQALRVCPGHETAAANGLAAHDSAAPDPAATHAAALLRTLDPDHQLVLLVDHDTPLPETRRESLELIADHLARVLPASLLWPIAPQKLGPPFADLTQREWRVLAGLNSDCGEKQLAAELQLSPHTLHSHIKAIYRKAQVRGRLALLERLHLAVRQFRAAQLLETLGHTCLCGQMPPIRLPLDAEVPKVAGHEGTLANAARVSAAPSDDSAIQGARKS